MQRRRQELHVEHVINLLVASRKYLSQPEFDGHAVSHRIFFASIDGSSVKRQGHSLKWKKEKVPLLDITVISLGN